MIITTSENVFCLTAKDRLRFELRYKDGMLKTIEGQVYLIEYDSIDKVWVIKANI